MKLSHLGLCGFGMLLACSSAESTLECTTAEMQSGHESVIGGVPSTSADDAIIFFGDPNPTSGMMCSAVMVTPRIALTARHCVSSIRDDENVECSLNGTIDPARSIRMQLDKEFSIFRAYTGVHATSGSASLARVQAIDTDMSNDESCVRDFAVVTFDRDVVKVPPMATRDSAPTVGEHLRVVGYGAIDDKNNFSDERQTRDDIVVRKLGPDVALRSSGSKAIIADGEFLTSTGFCVGDSGGPLLDGAGQVVGLVSRKLGACSTADNLYVGMKYVTPVLDIAKARLLVAASDSGVEDAGIVADAALASTNEQSEESTACSAHQTVKAPSMYGVLSAVLMLAAKRRTKKTKSAEL